MKILKKVLCVLLSSMFLLFAGACNQGNDAGKPQTYEDTTTNEFVGFSITAKKTKAFGESDEIEIVLDVTAKKNFVLFTGDEAAVQNFIHPVCLNDAENKKGTYWDLNSVLPYKNLNRLHSSLDRAGSAGGLTSIEIKTNETYQIKATYRREYFENSPSQFSLAKEVYRVYVCIYELYDIEKVDLETIFSLEPHFFLIPTDIVLNMQ